MAGKGLKCSKFQALHPREFRSWVQMKQRCLNPRATGYRNYGGRGIRVCERWMTFENFLSDMGNRPDGTSLDRIDNDGHYEPNNCRWATAREQGLNRRMSVFLVVDGRKIGASELGEMLGIAPSAARNRVRKFGEAALTMKKAKRLAPQERARLARLHASGASIQSLVEEFGVSKSTVWNITQEGHV